MQKHFTLILLVILFMVRANEKCKGKHFQAGLCFLLTPHRPNQNKPNAHAEFHTAWHAHRSAESTLCNISIFDAFLNCLSSSGQCIACQHLHLFTSMI